MIVSSFQVTNLTSTYYVQLFKALKKLQEEYEISTALVVGHRALTWLNLLQRAHIIEISIYNDSAAHFPNYNCLIFFKQSPCY